MKLYTNLQDWRSEVSREKSKMTLCCLRDASITVSQMFTIKLIFFVLFVTIRGGEGGLRRKKTPYPLKTAVGQTGGLIKMTRGQGNWFSSQFFLTNNNTPWRNCEHILVMTWKQTRVGRVPWLWLMAMLSPWQDDRHLHIKNKHILECERVCICAHTSNCQFVINRGRNIRLTAMRVWWRMVINPVWSDTWVTPERSRWCVSRRHEAVKLP